MKAITPVIALVMLLLITVGITGVSYTWFGGLVSSSTKKSISIPPGGAYCADGDIKIYALNNGDAAITANDIIVAQVDGVDVKNTPFFGDMRSDLVGYWKFDETSGITAKDSSGVVPPNDGTLVGNPQHVVGKARNALVFNGVDDYVNVIHSAVFNTNTITIGAWAMLRSTSADSKKIVDKTEGGFKDLFLDINDGVPRFCVGDGATMRCSGSPPAIELDKWYHFAGVFDGTKVIVYVNGAAYANSWTGTRQLSVTNLLIGAAWNFDVDRYWNGIIDEVKIYNKAAGDVNIQPGASGLVVNYPGTDGKHTVRVGTSSNIAEATVSCA